MCFANQWARQGVKLGIKISLSFLDDLTLQGRLTQEDNLAMVSQGHGFVLFQPTNKQQQGFHSA